MARRLTRSANRIIEDQLADHAKDLEAELDGDVLALVGPIVYGTDDAIRDAVLEMRLSLWTTNGEGSLS
jgi:hypothetical protein